MSFGLETSHWSGKSNYLPCTHWSTPNPHCPIINGDISWSWHKSYGASNYSEQPETYICMKSKSNGIFDTVCAMCAISLDNGISCPASIQLTLVLLVIIGIDEWVCRAYFFRAWIPRRQQVRVHFEFQLCFSLFIFARQISFKFVKACTPASSSCAQLRSSPFTHPHVDSNDRRGVYYY